MVNILYNEEGCGIFYNLGKGGIFVKGVKKWYYISKGKGKD